MQLFDHASAVAYLRQVSTICGDEESIATAIAAERIRTDLSLSDESLATTAISWRVRDIVAPLFPTKVDGARDRSALSLVQSVLKGMAATGDVFRESDDASRYRPSALRLINFGPRAEYALVVGGAPTPVAEAEYGARLRLFGVSRFVRRSEMRRQVRTDEGKWQNASDWLGIDVRDLKRWTAETIGDLFTKSELGPPIGFDAIEVMSVAAYKRWRPIENVGAKGVQLCRGRDSHGPAKWSYFLAILKSSTNGVEVQRSKRIGYNVAKRLQFGICCRSGRKTRFRAVLDDERLVVSGLGQLPSPEVRLSYLAQRIKREDGVAQFVFPRILTKILQIALAPLGAELQFNGVQE